MPIPILGQPMQILTWYPTTLLRCNCKETCEEKVTLIISGMGGSSMCPLCGAKATVTGIGPDGNVVVTIETKDPIGRVQ